MYCQLKYVKHQYLTLFKNWSEIEILLLFIAGSLISLAFINTFSDKALGYIAIMFFLIPFITFYIKGIKYCKEK